MQDNASILQDKEPVSFYKKWGILLIFALLAAIVCCFCNTSVFNPHFISFSGVGLTAIVYAGILLVFLLARKSDSLKYHASFSGWFTLVCGILAGFTLALYEDIGFRFINVPLTLILTAHGLYALFGGYDSDPLTAQGLSEGIRRLFPALFRHWGTPFAAAKRSKKAGLLSGLGLGLVICVPLLAVVIALLASADSVFGSMVNTFFESIINIDGLFIWRLVRAAIITLCVFSLLYTLTQKKQMLIPAAKPHIPALTFSMALGALTVIFILFVYVQFKCLFGGAETAAMEGGYAEYARSGFFQLVMVSFITLLIIFPALTIHPQNKVIRAFCLLLSALTMVIVFSAFWRMRLYIQVFGLSILRYMTIWGIAVIFLAFVLTIIRCFKPEFKITKPLLMFAVATWLLVCLVNPNLVIAKYNIHGYNEGRLAELDTYYIEQLMPDAAYAIDDIENDELRAKLTHNVISNHLDDHIGFYHWSFSRIGLNKLLAQADTRTFTLHLKNTTDDAICSHVYLSLGNEDIHHYIFDYPGYLESKETLSKSCTVYSFPYNTTFSDAVLHFDYDPLSKMLTVPFPLAFGEEYTFILEGTLSDGYTLKLE